MRNKFTKLTLAASIGLASALTISCYSDDDRDPQGCPNVVIGNNTMSCGGQTYRTVKIGEQTWMAENLNYNVSGSNCYENNEANCTIYGRQYKWVAAMALPASSCNSEESCSNYSQINAKHRGICPSGWHIPSDEEWTILIDFVGIKAGTKLKATSGWNSYRDVPSGSDTYGFTALPGGGGDEGISDSGDWWSATHGGNKASILIIYNNSEDVTISSGFKAWGLFSVRCLQD